MSNTGNATYRTGQFVWRELMTTDTAKAKGFYGELFGWAFKDVDMGPMTYTLVHVGEKQIAGMMKSPPGGPPHPFWSSYVSVTDVDATVKAWEASGGKLLMPAQDIPNVGRFAYVMDPQGGVLAVFRGATGDGEASMPPKLGEFCWESLMTSDVAKAKDFYMKVIGWTLGEGPDPSMVVMKSAGGPVADVMGCPPGVPTMWGTYVHVEKVEASRDRAAKLGGNVLMPLLEIPKIGRIATVADPTGAVISLFQSQM